MSEIHSPDGSVNILLSLLTLSEHTAALQLSSPESLMSSPVQAKTHVPARSSYKAIHLQVGLAAEVLS